MRSGRVSAKDRQPVAPDSNQISLGTPDEVQRAAEGRLRDRLEDTLSRVLKYLASEKIVQREVLGTQPFTVRYALTDKGEQIRPIMQSLKAWGETWILGDAPLKITQKP